MIKKLIILIVFTLSLFLCYGQGPTKINITTDSLNIYGAQSCRIKFKNLDTKIVLLDTTIFLPFTINIKDKPPGKYLLLTEINDERQFYILQLQP